MFGRLYGGVRLPGNFHAALGAATGDLGDMPQRRCVRIGKDYMLADHIGGADEIEYASQLVAMRSERTGRVFGDQFVA